MLCPLGRRATRVRLCGPNLKPCEVKRRKSPPVAPNTRRRWMFWKRNYRRQFLGHHCHLDMFPRCFEYLDMTICLKRWRPTSFVDNNISWLFECIVSFSVTDPGTPCRACWWPGEATWICNARPFGRDTPAVATTSQGCKGGTKARTLLRSRAFFWFLHTFTKFHRSLAPCCWVAPGASWIPASLHQPVWRLSSSVGGGIWSSLRCFP